MILLVALLSDHLVMPAEYLRDPDIGILLFGEDIEVFYLDKSKRIRFQGLAAGDLLLEESGWERERQGLGTEYLRLDLSDIDSVRVYLPLHDIRDKGTLQGCLVRGGCAALGVPVGIWATLGIIYIALATGDYYLDIGGAIALGYAALYGGGCLGAVGGCLAGAYIYEKKLLRPSSKAKTQILLDRVKELSGQEVK